MLPALAQIRPNLSIDLPHIIWRSAAARPLVISREDAFARLRMTGAVRFIGYEEAMDEIEAMAALGELPAIPVNAKLKGTIKMAKIVSYQIGDITSPIIQYDRPNLQQHDLFCETETVIDKNDQHKIYDLLWIAYEGAKFSNLPSGVGRDNDAFIAHGLTKIEGFRAMTAEIALWIKIEHDNIQDPFITQNEIGWRTDVAYGPDEAGKTLGVSTEYLRRCKSGERRIHPTVARILRVITSFQDRPEADDRLIDLLDAAEPKIDNLIEVLLSLNLDLDAAAHMLGIARSTVYNWWNHLTKIHPAAAKLLNVLAALPVFESRSLIHRITNAARPNPHY